MEDFEDLIYQFAKQMRVRFSFNAIQALKEHHWSGNIRELKNVVARAAAYMPGKHIQPEDISNLIDPAPSAHEDPSPGTLASSYPDISGGLASTDFQPGTSGSVIKEIEREMIIRRLVANRGNQRRTAQDLGMPKSTLHDRLKAYSIDVDAIVKETTEFKA
jgi:DNA-binding NtrC family response regulator